MKSLDRAVKYFEDQDTTLHKELDVSNMCVRQWYARGAVPPESCREIERLTNGEITRADLNPYIFGPIQQDKAAA